MPEKDRVESTTTPAPPDTGVEEKKATTETEAVAPENDFNVWEVQRRKGLGGEEEDAPESTAIEVSKTDPEATAKAAETAAASEAAGEKGKATTEKDGKEEVTPKKPGGFQRRINRLTKDKHELERRVADMEEPSAGGDKKTPAGEAATIDASPAAITKAEAADPTKPEAGNFDTYEEFTEKFANWLWDKREKAATAAVEQEHAKAAATKVLDKWTDRVDEAREAHEDYDDVVQEDVPITQAMEQALLESEQGAEMAYYLGQNPDEAARISKLSPVQSIREMARIEATFDDSKTEATPQRKPVTSAPAPVKTVSGGRAGERVSTLDPEPDFNVWEINRRREVKQQQAA